MVVKEIMTKGVETVRPDTVLEEAANKMKTLDVGVLPVFDGKLLMGMLTDRDIVVRSVSKGDDPRNTSAGDVMSTEIVSCYDDDELQSVAEMMESKKVRRIPVLNRDEELVGMISLGDMADRGDRGLAGEALEEVSRPSAPEKE
jgi:CBS domain-containing protein